MDCNFLRKHWDYEKRAEVFDGCGFFMGHIPPNLRGMTLQGYDATTENEPALAAAIDFTAGRRRNLYLFGDPGVGKTHLLVGSYMAMCKTECPRGLSFNNIARLLKIERDDFQTREEAEDKLLDVLSRREVLFLDDLCAEAANGRTREFLYLLLNNAIEKGSPRLFITGNKGIKWVSENISDRIGSRMAGLFGRSGVIEVLGTDRRLEVAQ